MGRTAKKSLHSFRCPCKLEEGQMHVPLFNRYSLPTTSFITGDATKSGVGVIAISWILILWHSFFLNLIHSSIILFYITTLLGIVSGKNGTRGVPSAQSRKRLAIDLGSAVEMQGNFCQCSLSVSFRFHLFKFFSICFFHRCHCFLRIFIRTCKI